MPIKLKQILVDSDFDVNNFKIVNLKDPDEDGEAVNLKTLKQKIQEYSGVTSISDLSDVNINDLDNYDILMFSGGTWINTKDIELPDDANIYIGDWRIGNLNGNLRVDKKVGGEWKLGGEFFV